MRLSEYRAFLKEKKESLLYLLAGNEPILIDRLAEHLQKETLGAAANEFNFTLFSASDATAAQVIAEAQQVSMLSPRRLIRVKEAGQFSKEDQEELIVYCEKPVPSSVIIFTDDAIDKRTRFYKALAEHGRVLDCSSPPPEDLREWVQERIRRDGKEIDAAAIDFLIEASGNSLTFLALELEKLLIYCLNSKKISEEDVEKITARNRVKTVFNLWDSVALRKKDEAFSILRELTVEGMAVPELVGLLRWQMSRLVRGRELLDAGKDSKKEMSSTLGVPFYFVDKFMAQVKRFSGEGLSRAYEATLVADEEAKSGALKNADVLDRLLYRLMRA